MVERATGKTIEKELITFIFIFMFLSLLFILSCAATKDIKPNIPKSTFRFNDYDMVLPNDEKAAICFTRESSQQFLLDEQACYDEIERLYNTCVK